jgi:threonine/homoserine/homoserine lactone efflux protein
MNIGLFTAFVLISFVLVVTPGPIVTLIISTGATRGMRAALTTVGGTTLGNVVLLTAIGFGLTWAVGHAIILFEILRWGGAAYLIWLGVQAWRRAGSEQAAAPPAGHVHFIRGALVAVSNPKTIAFFTAFLPQFIDRSLPAAPQLAAMCCVTVLLAVLTDTSWAVASGFGRTWFMRRARAKLLGRLSGSVLIGGGIWLSLARRPG